MLNLSTLITIMRRMAVVVFATILFAPQAGASTPPDEGMWLPIFVEDLNIDEMQRLGLKLTAEDIYSINNSSIKDAVVGLSNSSRPNGFFCTGEIVSDQGLMFTNHHCGFDKIQDHTTIEHDYLKDGFWAMSLEEELPNPGLTATFFVRMENVTDSIIPFLSDTLSESERSGTVSDIADRLEEAASEDGRYHTVVKGLFAGNEYYLFVYEVFKDVRLVGAPPSAIGKYGGDTDNWMWPRHTGDFSIFRVYSGPDGEPAEYSEDNIPLKPKQFLPVSLDGVEEGDFAMIWGYPGGTDRYLTSYGIKYQLDYFNPSLIKVMGAKLEVWKEDMDANRQVAIDYASNYSGIANFWKYSIGQSKGLKQLDVYGQKKELEEEFTRWVNKDEARKEKYGNVLPELKEAYSKMGPLFRPVAYAAMAGIGGPEIFGKAQQFGQLYQLLSDKDTDDEVLDETIEELRAGLDDMYKEYSASTDQKVFATLMKLYYDDLPKESLPPEFVEMVEDYDGDFREMAEDVYDKSIFNTKEEVEEFLEKPKFKKLEKDPAFILSKAMQGNMMQFVGPYRAAQSSMSKNERLYIAGLREMQPEKAFYPDANSTMRLTYGTVRDYVAADAVRYDYITHLYGVMEKEDPTNNEFIVPEKLKELFKAKDYGRYGENGKLVTCFLTDNDITGGNSGSPVMNGNGELIGIAFDGNWEAMSGDIAYEPELQRTINVDIRYVLFIIDKYAGAQNLIDELKIVKRPKVKTKMTEEGKEMLKATQE